MRLSKTVLVSIILMLVLLAGLPGLAYAQQSGPDLAVHYVEGRPRAGQFAYDVDVYFSAYQTGGEPVRNLQLGDLVITEDGKRVEIASLELAESDPIRLVIVMDTSGSMRGGKMQAARSAAAQFVSGLGSADQVAVISFDSEVQTEIGFTDNLDDARRVLESLDAPAGAGTCLYDALYDAVTLTATIPSGRRAIIVLTDGVDELPDGSICSRYREEDVTNLARAGGTRVPIYTVGLGSRIDTAMLQRMADVTGGRYQFASDEGKLQGLFGGLLSQLRTQYRATYVSTAAPGPHNLVVEANIGGQTVRALRDFVLPSFGYNLVFLSPKPNETLGSALTLSVDVSGQGDAIERVEFYANGNSIGVDRETPYGLDWQVPDGLSGSITLEAVAFGVGDLELGRTAVRVQGPAPVAQPTAVPQVTETPAQAIEPPTGGMALLFILGGLGLFFLLVGAGVVFFILRRRQEKERERERLWQEKVQGVGVSESAYSSGDERTMDAFFASVDAYGALVVLHSDDPAMTGQRFELTKTSTRLGRKADNDIIFPKDSPVSRYHALVEEQAGSLFLSEVIASEDGKRPVYGTFVNEAQIEGRTQLRNGDEIRLGKRVRLRLELKEQTLIPDEATLDEFSLSDEKTIDDFERVDSTKTKHESTVVNDEGTIVVDNDGTVVVDDETVEDDDKTHMV